MGNDTFLCTRPSLASRLIAAGFQGQKTPNPWHPDLDAWVFPLCDGTREIAAAFYGDIGKPLPVALQAHGDTWG